MTPYHAHGVASPGIPLDLVAFVTLGLLGSAAHCVGMCAPFVLLVSRRDAGPGGRPAAAAHLWYSTGRLITYAALGALAGAFGGAVQRAGAFVGLQRTTAVLAGVLLVVSAGASLLATAPFAAPGRLLSRVTARVMARMPGHPLALGLVLGLLPCGLLYSAVVAATTREGALAGATSLAAFGLGTTPALLGVAAADRLVLAPRAFVTRLAHVFVLAMGLWYLWRGVGPLGLQ